MDRNLTLEIETQFQHAFTRVFEDQIQQLIDDSRKEALAQAKQILRDNALNNVLQAVVGRTVSHGNGSEPPAPEKTPADLPVKPDTQINADTKTNGTPAGKADLKQTETSAKDESEVVDIVSFETVGKPKIRVKDHPVRVAVKPENVQNTRTSQAQDPGNAPPVLNDRILEEIEAIREQIRRNELLLSQIKPFVQETKVQK